MHPLRSLPRPGEPSRGDDGVLFVGVTATQVEPAPAEKVGDDLLHAVFALSFVHSGTPFFAAARSARSCMTLIAPTVECISAATSFNEYPWRKRSSSTRR